MLENVQEGLRRQVGRRASCFTESAVAQFTTESAAPPHLPSESGASRNRVVHPALWSFHQLESRLETRIPITKRYVYASALGRESARPVPRSQVPASDISNRSKGCRSQASRATRVGNAPDRPVARQRRASATSPGT